jgi:alginate O-acetyltransferase complex protein AlgI
MVFSSIVFLLFFLPALLIVYYLVPKQIKNIVLLAFSILFYSWGAPKFIFVILGTTFVDFHLVKWMCARTVLLHRRILFILSISINLGILLYFKYSNFCLENVNEILSLLGYTEFSWTRLVLPIGISFYTFESITYVVDAYRGVHKPLRNFWDYQLYIILFPKLIAGPIVRFHEIADQIIDRSANEIVDNRLTGFYRFVFGLSKKVLIANQLGMLADQVFGSDIAQLDSYSAWMGLLAYAFQLYFDFSGYSDMAIGLSNMLGFKLPENFNNPYVAKNLRDFWRRWHMTLNRWFVDYVYTPVVIEKRHWGVFAIPFAIILTFGLSGLWHGASWNFVVWGLYHGFFVLMEILFLNKFYKKLKSWIAIPLTFFIVLISWIFFRIEKFEDSLLFFRRLFLVGEIHVDFDKQFYLHFAVAIFFAFCTAFNWGRRLQDAVYYNKYSFFKHVVMASCTLILFFISVSYIAGSSFNPFIYFRF